jgi:threonyl-tRNA synthetase
MGYAKRLRHEFSEFRVGIEDRSWTLGRKIREAQEERVPYMLVVGSDEAESETVSVRDRKERERQGVSIESLREHLREEEAEKRAEPDFLA